MDPYPFNKFDLFSLGRKPVQPRMFQDKIKREKPPPQNGNGSFPPVPDILDSERPVDRLARYPARPASAID